MKKLVRKYGSSLVITFNNEEQKIYNIKEGDFIDIEDIIVIKSGKKHGKV